MLWQFVVAAAVVVLDQSSKHFLQDAQGSLLPGVIGLHGLRNTGAAFSLFNGRTGWLAVVSVVAAAGIGIYMLRARLRGLAGIGLALLLGGTLGNLIDRLTRGYVVDFLRFEFVDFPVFNVADVALTMGAALLVFSVLYRPRGHV